ncbi:unnamed protein product [Diatraea saccharalis]|uniref:Ketosynthase family 3 (KS3) domain-containing protein n=1 Tax=Diatraea saccharalis TaxID=40085 RepID=A0A9N9R7Z7_9NEOP|nr:unnamed protein product [Diatraea saccharalis]
MKNSTGGETQLSAAERRGGPFEVKCIFQDHDLGTWLVNGRRSAYVIDVRAAWGLGCHYLRAGAAWKKTSIKISNTKKKRMKKEIDEKNKEEYENDKRQKNTSPGKYVLCPLSCSRAMLSNQISRWLGVTGPSYVIDAACSSSLYAMEHAFRAIRDGHCDAAIVGGSNLCLQPSTSLQFLKLGAFSADGRCKSFDESANGYTRSEAVVVCFLQKAKEARR